MMKERSSKGESVKEDFVGFEENGTTLFPENVEKKERSESGFLCQKRFNQLDPDETRMEREGLCEIEGKVTLLG